MSISASINQPSKKNTKTVILSDLNTCKGFIHFTQLNVLTSSAVAKTAGITVEKSSVAKRKYSKSLNWSLARYIQFCVRAFNNSNNHQTGADMTNNPIYLLMLRRISEVPFLVKTNASIKRQYPNYIGKNKTCVRNPSNPQFSIQKTISNTRPIHPYRGIFRFIFWFESEGIMCFGTYLLS